MCGINGFVVRDQDSIDSIKGILNSMNKQIKHRGPDDDGIYAMTVNGFGIGLAQVRLAIIDLTTGGHQPMIYDRDNGASNEKTNIHQTDTLSITFNGEIYNYQELKDELMTLGYVFTSKTDTEVILASFLEWGTACTSHFNGFWAFGIYDKRTNTLFCSRDRLGVKPFYYYLDEQKFIFSSELKGILAFPTLPKPSKKDIDTDAIDFYMSAGFIPSPWTIYNKIRKLEAGCSLVISLGHDRILLQEERYYDIPEYNPGPDKQKLIEEGRKLLEDSVKIRLFTSDVPVGAFLSGGLDSSAVVSEMTKLTQKENLNTFSIGFEGKYDESKYIHVVKDAFGTNHHHEYFKEENFEKLLDNISYYFDEPFGDYSSFPTAFVSTLAKKHVTVCLSGDGGDEIFGGYMMHQVAAQMELIRCVPYFLRKVLFFLIPQGSNNLSTFSKLKEALRVSLFPREEFYAQIGASTLYRPQVYRKRTIEKMRHLLARAKGNYIQAVIDFDLLHNTLGDHFLTKVDRASMSQALEIRSPFLDWRWIERSRKVPVKRKVTIGRTKILMREIIKDLVPSLITQRGKKGFQPPIDKRILQDKYAQQLPTLLQTLYTHNILNRERKEFYEKQVFSNDNSIYNTYKIRLLLLYKRYEKRFNNK